MMRNYREGRWDGAKELSDSVRNGKKTQFLPEQVQRELDNLFRRGIVERPDLDQVGAGREGAAGCWG